MSSAVRRAGFLLAWLWVTGWGQSLAGWAGQWEGLGLLAAPARGEGRGEGVKVGCDPDPGGRRLHGLLPLNRQLLLCSHWLSSEFQTQDNTISA